MNDLVTGTTKRKASPVKTRSKAGKPGKPTAAQALARAEQLATQAQADMTAAMEARLDARDALRREQGLPTLDDRIQAMREEQAKAEAAQAQAALGRPIDRREIGGAVTHARELLRVRQSPASLERAPPRETTSMHAWTAGTTTDRRPTPHPAPVGHEPRGLRA